MKFILFEIKSILPRLKMFDEKKLCLLLTLLKYGEYEYFLMICLVLICFEIKLVYDLVEHLLIYIKNE